MRLNEKEWLKILNKYSKEIQHKERKAGELLGYNKYPLPCNFNLKYYYNKGIIKKEDLINDTVYFGLCRNAGIAVWDAKENVFWYLRIKFHTKFFEKINHISDDNGYDLFLPTESFNKGIK